MAMKEQETTAFVRKLMMAFAERTGLVGEQAPTRYLWTDAFAVCNLLELERRTSDERYRELALRLVDQVHQVLGRHRADDPRTGWISGLGEDEGAQHPTKGGLRIGKARSVVTLRMRNGTSKSPFRPRLSRQPIVPRYALRSVLDSTNTRRAQHRPQMA